MKNLISQIFSVLLVTPTYSQKKPLRRAESFLGSVKVIQKPVNMNKILKCFVFTTSLYLGTACQNTFAQSAMPGSIRSPVIEKWEAMKFGMFIHFGMNTFVNGNDLDDSKSPARTYNPVKLNVRQWIHTAKEAGMTYAVLTVKHSSGFCLWDSKDYDYDVAASSNTTDVVAEFMKACAAEGIKPGFYYCILDAYQNNTWGQLITEEHYQQVLKHLTELHTRYKGVIEQWIDIPDNCNQSQRQGIYDLIKKINPTCLVLLNQGLGVSQTNMGQIVEPGHWPTDLINGEFYPPPASGHQPIISVDNVKYYLPMETCDNGGDNSNNADGSSAGNWFFTKRYKIKSVDELYALYKTITARKSNFLLNIPPNASGVISTEIVDRLRELRKKISEN
jgi:alpha-L-fucosidase